MNFVTSHFRKMNLWPVQHFFNIFVIPLGWVCDFAPSKPTQKWGQICWKSVQLVRGSSFWNDLLQNPFFKDEDGIICFKTLAPGATLEVTVAKDRYNNATRNEVVTTNTNWTIPLTPLVSICIKKAMLIYQSSNFYLCR